MGSEFPPFYQNAEGGVPLPSVRSQDMQTHKSDCEPSVRSLAGYLHATQSWYNKNTGSNRKLGVNPSFPWYSLFSSVFIGAAVLWLPMCSVGRRLKQVAKAHCNTKVQTLLRAVFK